MKKLFGVLVVFACFGLIYILHNGEIMQTLSASQNGSAEISNSSINPHSGDDCGVMCDTTEFCYTIDWSKTRYCTSVGKRTIMFGEDFNLSSNMLNDLGIPLKVFISITRNDLNDFVFATAANVNYFHVAMDAIGNVQRLLPNHTIYFYDLDVQRSQNDVRKIQDLCNVVYRKFNYSRYPAHVKFLKNYAFKALLVHEMLSEFPRVFWIDSSIRFQTSNLSLTLDEVYTSGGILTFDFGGHSNFAATHESMYNYLPISASDAINTGQYGANSIYITRTEKVYTRIIYWWVLCSLKKDCMAPDGAQLNCKFKGKDVWAGCHRFDQSAINILLAHHFRYNVSRYSSRHGQLSVFRSQAHKESLIVCPTKKQLKSAKYFS